MLEEIPCEVLLVISQYIPLIYKISMSETCESIYKKIGGENKKIIKDKIIKKLRNLVPDPVLFLEKIIEGDCVISGGFILECLYEENWKSKDLDIWCSENKGYYITNDTDLMINGYNISSALMQDVTNDSTSHLFLKYLHSQGLTTYSGPLYDPECLNSINIRYININGSEFKIPMEYISCGRYHLSHIDKSFDMDICKVAYGSKYDRLFIKNKQSIYEKKCKYSRDINNDIFLLSYYGDDTKRYQDLIDNRINKYRDIGFLIVK